jgi:hypothetical protein
MKFDFKITAWERVWIPEDQEEKALDAIKEGVITSSNSLIEFLDNIDSFTTEIIGETDHQMTVEENDGFSTIEVVDDYGQTIYQNSDK